MFYNYIQKFGLLICLVFASLHVCGNEDNSSNDDNKLDFEKYFSENTLRFNFQHAGDAENEYYFFENLQCEGKWAGSKNSLINPYNYGEQMFKIIDTEDGKTIYQNGYCTLFNEWQTTKQAITTMRSMPEAIIFPHPKHDFIIEIYSRNKKTKEFEKKFGQHVSIGDYNIKPYNKKYESIDIEIGGENEKCLDIVLLPDGFDIKEKERFMEACRNWSKALLGYAPFSENRHRINTRAVWAPSQQSGISSPGEGKWIDNILDNRFYTFGSERYQMTENFQKVRDIASNAPYETIFILTNTEKYGGGGIYNFYGLGSAFHKGQTDEVYVHEFGHSLLGLGDEYVEEGNTVSALYPPGIEPWEANLTNFTDFDSKWKPLVKAKTKIPTPTEEVLKNKNHDKWPIGAYEGGGYLSKGMYRPWPKCMMNQLYIFCPVCQKAINDYLDYICK